MTYNEYKSIKNSLEKVSDELSKKINSFPKLPNGMITEEARKRPEFIQLVKSFDYAFKQLRNFNSLKESKIYAKQHAKEKRQLRFNK